MDDIKQESKLSIKNKYLVLAGLTFALLGVVLFRRYFPEFKSQFSDALFIASLVGWGLIFFQKKK